MAQLEAAQQQQAGIEGNGGEQAGETFGNA
jgi:hypothetical protein